MMVNGVRLPVVAFSSISSSSKRVSISSFELAEDDFHLYLL